MGGGGGQEAGVSEPFFTMNPNLKFCFFRGGGEGATVSLFFKVSKSEFFFFFFLGGGGGGGGGLGGRGVGGLELVIFFSRNPNLKRDFFLRGRGGGELEEVKCFFFTKSPNGIFFYLGRGGWEWEIKGVWGSRRLELVNLFY